LCAHSLTLFCRRYSYGIVLVAMMRCDDTIVNFFFNALMRKMGKQNRTGIGLGVLNKNVEQGRRPTLPKKFYPGMINLIWRCWDDDPDKRPDFDEIVGLPMDDVGHEIWSNEEPIFGSDRIIAEVDQRERDLIGAGGEMVSKLIVDKIGEDQKRELDILVMELDRAIHEAIAEKEKMLKQLKDEQNKSILAKHLELKEKDKVILELRTTGRTERPKEDERRDSQVTKEMSGLTSMLGRGGGGGDGAGEEDGQDRLERAEGGERHHGHVRAVD